MQKDKRPRVLYFVFITFLQVKKKKYRHDGKFGLVQIDSFSAQQLHFVRIGILTRWHCLAILEKYTPLQHSGIFNQDLTF